MWRFLAGAGAMAALAGAGFMIFSGHASPQQPLLAARAAPAQAGGDEAQDLPDTVPAATARTREERRFGRYDKDRNGQITRDEYLAARRKAFGRLDRNGDGQLSFDEWGTKAIAKFATADRDRSGAMNASEFVTTRVVRRTPTRARADCPPAQRQRAEAPEQEET